MICSKVFKIMINVMIYVRSILIGSFVISIFIILQFAFAQSDEITVKHWFITSYDSGCSYGNEKALEFYQYITSQYLSQYGIHGSQAKGECLRLLDVQNNLDRFGQIILQYDLPIVILDGFSGLDYALSQSALGHYVLQGNDQVIIFASISPFIESRTGAWTLSHELSHFALRHQNYPVSIYGDWVHTVENNARSCLGDDLSIDECPELWTTVTSRSGKIIKMMKVYDGSISLSSTPQFPESISSQEYQGLALMAQVSAHNKLDFIKSKIAFDNKKIKSLKFDSPDAKKQFQNVLKISDQVKKNIKSLEKKILDIDKKYNAEQYYVVITLYSDIENTMLGIEEQLNSFDSKLLQAKKLELNFGSDSKYKACDKYKNESSKYKVCKKFIDNKSSKTKNKAK